MCTVAFIPFRETIVVSSLRDEDPCRPRAIFTPSPNKNGIYGPLDPKGGGTWFAVSKSGQVIVLLNGGFEKHHPSGTYHRSRGLVVNDMISQNNPGLAWDKIKLEGMEPFTLITHTQTAFHHRVWDGNKKHAFPLDPALSHIWSSSTLYDEDAKVKRKKHFTAWLERQDKTHPPEIMDCYQSLSDTANGFLMNRNEIVKTLSHTLLILHGQEAHLCYDELDSGKSMAANFKLNPS